MRIPRYLFKAPSGVFLIRRRMPAALIPLLGRPVIKKSLLIRDVGVARDLALNLWRAYDEFHQHVRMMAMAGMTEETKLLLERLKKQGTHYRLITRPDGTIEVEASGPEDHALAKEMVESIGDMRKEAIVQAWIREQGLRTRWKGRARTITFLNRVIPVRPELIRMGLLKRVNAMRAKGETQLFPNQIPLRAHRRVTRKTTLVPSGCQGGSCTGVQHLLATSSAVLRISQ